MASDPGQRVDQYMRLLLAHQERLYRFVRMAMPNSQQIDDVLQETFLVMWQKFDESCSAESFYPWACRIARLKVLEAFARNQRDLPVLDTDIIEQMMIDESLESDPQADAKQILQSCMDKLPVADRDLIELRYEPGMRVEAMAAQLSRPANSISKSLGRIRHVLWQCMDDAMNSPTNAERRRP